MDQLTAKVESLFNEMLVEIQNSIKIPSVEEAAVEGGPCGISIAKSLGHALDVSASLGFKTVNLDGYIGYAEHGHGDDYVAVLGHLDVVPEGNGWRYPPYGGEIHDGKLYGRGVLDDKGPIFAALYALRAIKDLQLPLSKRVRIIFGTNEETGSMDVDYYMAREKPPAAGFTPDASFPIIYAEKGMFNFALSKKIGTSGNKMLKSIKGGQRPNMVPDQCEAVLVCENPYEIVKICKDFAQKYDFKLHAEEKNGEVHIKSSGISAHSSTPELGINAITQLFAFLESCNLEGEAAEFFTAINKYIGRETDGQSLGIAYIDEPSGKLTLNVGTVELANTEINLVCNIRYPVTSKYEDLIRKIQQNLGSAGLDVKSDDYCKPLYYPKDHPLITTLHRIFVEESGIEAEPIAIGGTTYAKSIPNIVAYGPEFPGDIGCCHEPNECISLKDLLLCAKIYAKAIYELAK